MHVSRYRHFIISRSKIFPYQKMNISITSQRFRMANKQRSSNRHIDISDGSELKTEMGGCSCDVMFITKFCNINFSI
jgi:hypothetical protein